MDPKPLRTNVAGFAEQLTGAAYLNVVKFPTATFVSTAIRPVGESSAEIDGNMTILGATRPLTLRATFVGSGKNVAGRDTIGFSAEGKFERQAFGLLGHPTIGDGI